MDENEMDKLIEAAVLDGVAGRIIADADALADCPCGGQAEIGRTCSGEVTWVACPRCDMEASTISDWNAGRFD
tara:strand:- start:568 stop:786 length:219 start_codon:yes stop_codon:yes gene_type:complete